VPHTAEAAAALGLALRHDDKRSRLARGKAAGGFVVGAVNLVEQVDGAGGGGSAAGGLAGVAAGFEQREVEPGGAAGDPVAFGVKAFENKTLLAQFFHVLPDGDAAHAEFAREAGAGNDAGLRFEQRGENDEFGTADGGGGGGGGGFHDFQSSPMSTQVLW
jgi:hypothetical protein